VKFSENLRASWRGQLGNENLTIWWRGIINLKADVELNGFIKIYCPVV
jgi:hypothetical protein